MRGRLHLALTAAAACGLTAGAQAAVSSPARAAASDCAVDEVCVWPASNYSGPVTTIVDEVCHTGQVGSALNGDSAPGQELRVYAQPNCAGADTVLAPGARSTTLSGQSYLNYHAPGA